MSRVIKSSLVVEEKGERFFIKEDEKIKKPTIDLEKIKRDIIMNAKEEGKKIIEKAREEADNYLEDTYIKSKEIIEESRQAGYEEGFRKGYHEGKKVAQKIIEEANQIKSEYLKKRKTLVMDIENEVMQLVIRTCEKIINTKLDEDREAIISIVGKGLNSLSVYENVTIRVSKEDYDLVEMSKDKILAMASLIDEISIKVDNSFKKGDCMIETSNGSVDVSITTQINEMKELITNLLNCE